MNKTRNEFLDAWLKLMDELEDTDPRDVEPNYPFEKSFAELYFDVEDWLREMREFD